MTKDEGLTMVTPDEAIAQARPLPSLESLAIPGLTDEEWDAFMDALTED